MSARPGSLGLSVGVWAALAVSLGAVWLHRWPLAIDDFAFEAWASYHALINGHPIQFLELAPVYGGSLELRLPFALLAAALGGGEQSSA